MLRPSPKAHDRVKVIADLMEQSLSLAEIDRRLGLSGTRVGQIAPSPWIDQVLLYGWTTA